MGQNKNKDYFECSDCKRLDLIHKYLKHLVILNLIEKFMKKSCVSSFLWNKRWSHFSGMKQEKNDEIKIIMKSSIEQDTQNIW